jgi:hypothetical protein
LNFGQTIWDKIEGAIGNLGNLMGTSQEPIGNTLGTRTVLEFEGVLGVIGKPLASEI